MALFRLIRLPNLLIVALTLALLYYLVLLPPFERNGITPLLDDLHFWIFAGIAIIITASGYIINDLTDLKADLYNKPQRVVVGKKIAVQTTYWLYFSLCLLGYVGSLYLAFYAGQIALINIYILAVGGLYFYSTHLKKRPLLGNLLVAAYCAGVAGILWFAERAAFAHLYRRSPGEALALQGVMIAYLFFAFMSTFFREIAKDLEDIPGDANEKYRTMPIIWGIKTSKSVAIATGLLLSFGIAASALWLLPALIALLALPVWYAAYRLYLAQSRQDYAFVSLLAKLIMLCGLLILIL